MAKCKIEQCLNCKKTFGVFDGCFEKKFCFTCIENIKEEQLKKKAIFEHLGNIKKKKKANKKVIGNKAEKIADLMGV